MKQKSWISIAFSFASQCKFLVVNTYVTLTRKFFKILAILSKIING